MAKAWNDDDDNNNNNVFVTPQLRRHQHKTPLSDQKNVFNDSTTPTARRSFTSRATRDAASSMTTATIQTTFTGVAANMPANVPASQLYENATPSLHPLDRLAASFNRKYCRSDRVIDEAVNNKTASLVAELLKFQQRPTPIDGPRLSQLLQQCDNDLNALLESERNVLRAAKVRDAFRLSEAGKRLPNATYTSDGATQLKQIRIVLEHSENMLNAVLTLMPVHCFFHRSTNRYGATAAHETEANLELFHIGAMLTTGSKYR